MTTKAPGWTKRESLLDRMGITPFDDDDEPTEYDPFAHHAKRSTKQRTSIQLSAGTRREIDWLSTQGYGNLSEVVALAVHQMYVTMRNDGE